jgi:hypothetical protein
MQPLAEFEQLVLPHQQSSSGKQLQLLGSRFWHCIRIDWIEDAEPKLGSEPVAARNAELAHGAGCLQLAAS